MIKDHVTYYEKEEEAEKEASVYRKRQKVKTDVFRVKYEEENQKWYVEQDLS